MNRNQEHTGPQGHVFPWLAGRPPASCRTEMVDFAGSGLDEYRDHFAMLIHDAFSTEECASLIAAAVGSNHGEWDQALFGRTQQLLNTERRMSDRILWDQDLLADAIYQRIRHHIPEGVLNLPPRHAVITGAGPVKRKETWRATRLNERLRFLRYTGGMYFRPHRDGAYITPDGYMSRLTIHLYLNDGRTGADRLVGGATRFWSTDLERFHDVNPSTGSVLVFQQRGLLHSGEDVVRGTKYTMRTDLMYRKVACDT